MKTFLKDASLVVAVLVALALVFAAAGRSLPLASYLAGGFIGLLFAAARAYRRKLEADARERQRRRR